MRALGRILALALIGGAFLFSARAHAQAALLMEEPYGFFGTLNPTGHNAIYFARVCAETPVRLRRCQPGESGAVIARYQGIKGYDWIAIPLLPYLYSVENAADVPARVDQEMVRRLRYHYRETRLQALGDGLPEGGFLHGGWTELVGVSFERRIYAFRFNTTEAQDDQLIAAMNKGPNHSRFNLLFSNCADFARSLLDLYFPDSFRRSVFPDAGMTTPKQIAYKLVRRSRKHPEMGLMIYEIPQTPGLHRRSHSNKSIAESLTTTAYAIPLAATNPYLTGGIFVDYLIRGRHHLIPKHPLLLDSDHLSSLTGQSGATDNAVGARIEADFVPELAPEAASDDVQDQHRHMKEGIVSYE
jgi:hypothetical protein